MVNLLPPETKRQIRAARMNVILYRYCVLIVLTATLLGGVFGLGFWATMNDRQTADSAKADTQTAAAPYAKTKTAAENFARDLATAKTILGSNVSFSKLVLDIAAVVPQGVILNNLSLGTNAKPDTPIDLSGRTTTYAAAVNLKNSLEASPIFEQVSITNISQSDVTGQTSDLVRRYPFAVGVRAKRTVQPATTQGAK